VARVLAFAGAHRFAVVARGSEGRTLRLRGPVAAWSRAFGVQLDHYAHQRGQFRGRAGVVQVPAELDGAITAVLGLDNRPVARPRLTATGGAAFTPRELAARYDFPGELDGGGERIGIVELGGGFVVDEARAYWRSLGVAPPSVVTLPAPNGVNRPGSDARADEEVTLDVQIAGAIAPAASLLVYFGDDASEQGLYEALRLAIHDQIHRPTILLVSWGGPESEMTAAFMLEVHALLKDAAHLGISLCAASGDQGSFDQPPDERDGHAHADFPAASPWILACGGTRLERDGSESVWGPPAPTGGSGGGVSAHFVLPAYQGGAGVPVGARAMRGLPDVAANADPATGYRVHLDGREKIVGGTSAAAALWAGFLARINQALGRRVGFVAPLLYGAGRATFHDITAGSNGAFRARAGWDECTGLGTPRGAQLIAALRALV
jgi:kumamolisin